MTCVRRLLQFTLTLIALFTTAAAGAEGKRTIVMVLDTSGSMANGSRDNTGKEYPATDPERLAVLGTQLILSLTEGNEDVTVFGFPEGGAPTAPPRRLSSSDLQGLVFGGGTPYLPAIDAASEKLASAPADARRVLIFFTDGVPSDKAEDLNVLRSHIQPIIKLGTHPAIIGLVPNGDGLSGVKPYLTALGGDVEANTVIIQDRSKTVEELTQALARAFDSNAKTGDLGSPYNFRVGAGVDEVLIAVAAESPGYDFQAQLDTPGTVAPVSSDKWRSGWNATDHATGRYWQTLRYAKPSGANLELTLRLLRPASGKVRFGIIYKYELVAQVRPESDDVTDGADVVLIARLVSEGKPLDKSGVAASGFQPPQFTIAGVPLSQVVAAPDGSFRVTWNAKRPSGGGPVDVRVTFPGDGGTSLSSTTSLAVREPAKLELHVPDSLDLGSWAGPSAWLGKPPQQQQCKEIDLSNSPGAQSIELTCTCEGWPPDGQSAHACCQPVQGSGAAGVGQPQRWRVCMDPRPCCGAMKSSASNATTRVVLAGKEPRYQAVKAPVAVYFEVTRASWIQCYWHWIAMALGAALAIWIFIGIVRPISFDSSAAFRVASSEAGLRKNQASVACEVPGGRRGFYRNARVALNASGDIVRDPKAAILVVEAAPGAATRLLRAAGLEKKDSRTGKWVPVPEKEFAFGLLSKAIYRVGQLYMKWE